MRFSPAKSSILLRRYNVFAPKRTFSRPFGSFRPVAFFVANTDKNLSRGGFIHYVRTDVLTSVEMES